MVSGGQVRSDSSSIATSCTNYSSAVDDLASNWKGSSYDSLHSQSQQVASEVMSIIKSEMEAFATACDLYEQYKSYKDQLKSAESNYNTAVSNNDTSAASTYSNQISECKNKMSSLKTQIESNLSTAKNGKIEAKSLSGVTTSTGSSNVGSSVNSIIQGAIDWAVAVAADDSHGYSQSTRWGNPNYDCSSLVISAYEAAGVSVKEAGAGYTGNMRSAFTKVGFQWIPGNPDVSTLQPGDVLLNEGQHTEMYIGDGMNVGAHSNKDGVDGDSSGKEINISNYHSFPWDGVLRYVGYDSAQKATV